LILFSILLVWLFKMYDSSDIGLLALLVAALGYVQMGFIFQSRHISTTGILTAVLTVGSFFLIPSYFPLVMAILGGGLLIGSGLWMIYARM
jgi:hypothetical protein